MKYLILVLIFILNVIIIITFFEFVNNNPDIHFLFKHLGSLFLVVLTFGTLSVGEYLDEEEKL